MMQTQAILAADAPGLYWIKAFKWMRVAILIGLSFGIGAWVATIWNNDAATPSLQRKSEALDKVVTKDVPRIKALTGCELVRAKFFEQAAKDSEVGLAIDLTKAPDCAPIAVITPLGKPRV